MKIRKVSAVAAAIVGAIVAPAAVSAQAEVTANAGYVSQYYYRGLLQKTSSASAGLDVAASSFSAGTWAADVGDGAEVDLYAAVDVPVSDMVSVSLGGTGYFYTGQFDDTYLEGNLGIGLGPISIEWSLGQYGNFDPDNKLKYTFIGITAEQNGLFATVGTSGYNTGFSDAISDAFDKDLGAQYLEAGYGFSAADLDFVISGIFNDALLSGQVDGDGNPTQELTFVFGVSKTFNLSGM
jgi:uncharacterized protein (TIGR02001 family)